MIVIKNKHVGEALRRDVAFVWHAVIAVVFIGFASSCGRGGPARRTGASGTNRFRRILVLLPVEIFHDSLRLPFDPTPLDVSSGRSAICRGRRECRAHRSAGRGRNTRPRRPRISSWPAAIVGAQMRGAGREIAVVQIVGLDPALDEARASARPASARVVDAASSTVCDEQRNAGIGQRAQAARACCGQFARMIGVERDIGRLAA